MRGQSNFRKKAPRKKTLTPNRYVSLSQVDHINPSTPTQTKEPQIHSVSSFPRRRESRLLTDVTHDLGFLPSPASGRGDFLKYNRLLTATAQRCADTHDAEVGRKPRPCVTSASRRLALTQEAQHLPAHQQTFLIHHIGSNSTHIGIES